MSVGVLEPNVAKRGDTTFRVDAETAEVIRKVAALKDMTIVEYLRSVVLPIAQRELIAEARKITKKADKPSAE